MIKLVHLFIICGISAATNLRGLVPPKDTSIQYTDEPDPAIYAAGQASAAVIAYGADVLLKGSPSSKQHGGTEPTALETPTTEDTSTTAPPADTSITPDPENPLLVKQPEPVPESKPVESAVDTTSVVVPESEKPGVEKASGYGEETKPTENMEKASGYEEETKPTEDDTLVSATEDHQNTMDSVAEETGESTPAIDDTSTTDSSETSTDTPVTEDTTTEETAASTPAIDDASTTDTSETSTDTPVTDESVTTPESTTEDASSSTTTTAPASDLETPASR